jgi:hypothetical protein
MLLPPNAWGAQNQRILRGGLDISMGGLRPYLRLRQWLNSLLPPSPITPYLYIGKSQ